MKTENIKFRGKSKKTGEWLYGDLVRNVEGAFAIVPPFEISMNNYCGNYEVDKGTIGQYTGLKDKNGREIYEGDILLWATYPVIVGWRGGAFCDCHLDSNRLLSNHALNMYKIIGNIHNNPELLTERA